MVQQTKTVLFYKDIDKCIEWIDKCCTSIIGNGIHAYVTISDVEPDTIRDNNDNRKFHAIMHDIWTQGVYEFSGMTLSMRSKSFEECKALLVTWFVYELEHEDRTLPKYLEIKRVVCPRTNQVISIRPSTTKFSKKISAEFCQFLWATGCDGGVKFTDPATREYEEMINSGQVES